MKLFFNPSLKSKTFKKDYDENLIVKRLFLVAFSMTVFGLIIFSKIVELAFFHDKQVIKNSSLVTKEKDPFRGNIKDRNDKILASNIFNYKLKAYPKFISDRIIFFDSKRFVFNTFYISFVNNLFPFTKSY